MILFVIFWGRGFYSVCMFVYFSIFYSFLSDVLGFSLRSFLLRELVINLAVRIYWE